MAGHVDQCLCCARCGLSCPHPHPHAAAAAAGWGPGWGALGRCSHGRGRRRRRRRQQQRARPLRCSGQWQRPGLHVHWGGVVGGERGGRGGVQRSERRGQQRAANSPRAPRWRSLHAHWPPRHGQWHVRRLLGAPEGCARQWPGGRPAPGLRGRGTASAVGRVGGGRQRAAGGGSSRHAGQAGECSGALGGLCGGGRGACAGVRLLQRHCAPPPQPHLAPAHSVHGAGQRESQQRGGGRCPCSERALWAALGPGLHSGQRRHPGRWGRGSPGQCEWGHGQCSVWGGRGGEPDEHCAGQWGRGGGDAGAGRQAGECAVGGGCCCPGLAGQRRRAPVSGRCAASGTWGSAHCPHV